MEEEDIWTEADKLKTIDDVFNKYHYEYTDLPHCKGEVVVRMQQSPSVPSQQKKLTFLATIQHFTGYPTFDGKSVRSIRDHVSFENKNLHIDLRTRCICGHHQDNLRINILKVFNQNRDHSVCFAIGGKCIQHFKSITDGKENNLLKERCKDCNKIINRRHLKRPNQCSDCYTQEQKIRKQLDNEILRNNFKHIVPYEWFCEETLTKYVNGRDRKKANYHNYSLPKVMFCKYLLALHYDEVDDE
jgi:hypothetical protein